MTARRAAVLVLALAGTTWACSDSGSTASDGTSRSPARTARSTSAKSPWSAADPKGPVSTREVGTQPTTIVVGTGLGPPSRPNSLEPKAETWVVATDGCARVRFDATARLAERSGRSASFAEILAYGPGTDFDGPQRWRGPFVLRGPDPADPSTPVGEPIALSSQWLASDQSTATVSFRVEVRSDRSLEPFREGWTLDRLTMSCEAPA